MREIHVYTENRSSDGYGAYTNGLKFYTKTGEEIPVTDVVSVDTNTATFKLNNIPGRVVITSNYGGSYVSSNIFSTGTSYSNSILPQSTDLFRVTFESDVRNVASIELQNVYTTTNGWRVEVDGKLITPESINPTLNVPFKVELPSYDIRCFIGTDGLYYFLRPDPDDLLIKRIEIDARHTQGELSIKNLRFSLDGNTFIAPTIVSITSPLVVEFKLGEHNFTATADSVYDDGYPVKDIIDPTISSNTPKFATPVDGGKIDLVFHQAISISKIAFEIPSATDSTSPWVLNTYRNNGEKIESFTVLCSNGQAMASRHYTFKTTYY